MRFSILTGAASLLLLPAAFAQFGPTTTVSSSSTRVGFVAQSTTATSTRSPTIPSPTESSGCYWHETHWDCPGSESEESGECIIHVGHTHGDCSAAQLACGAIALQDYNMGLHVGSIFIILVASAAGVLIPVISGWVRNKNGDRITALPGHTIAFGKEAGFRSSLFFLAKHFGTGIIISTAFIHLLHHGMVMFQNECIGHLVYESASEAIAMAAALVTFLFDFVGTRIAHKVAQAPNSPALESPTSENGSEKGPRGLVDGHGTTDTCDHHVDAIFAAEQNWQVLLLEAGIIFHSIMIGVTLGASGSNGWTTLLIVIIFHQYFEGSALGARIATLYWLPKMRIALMCLAFTIITPLGIVIGIGARSSFSQNGKSALLSVGILNSISAGILLYTAFKLLSADFVDGPLRTAKKSKVFVALAALVVGIIAMSILGKWA